MASAEKTLQDGIHAVKVGNFERARRLFNQVVEEDPDSEQGWYWLGLIASDQDKRVACFMRALEINPTNREARDRLERLGVPIPEALDVEIPDPVLDTLEDEETGPLPSPPGKAGLETGGQAQTVPEIFQPLDDEEPQPPQAEDAEENDDSGFFSTEDFRNENFQDFPEVGDELETWPKRRVSWAGRLVPILAILVLVVCASTVYLSTRGGGQLFGLALAQSSPTPSPSATRPPATATATASPLPPTSTPTPIPPSPSPSPTLSQFDQLASLDEQATAATLLTQSGQITDAILAWGQVIETAPDWAEAYYGRGRSYLTLVTQNQLIPDNAQEMLQHGLDDLNQAVQIGPTRGVYYQTRFQILDWMTQLESFRAKRDPLLEQMLADVQIMEHFGLATPFGDPNPGALLLRLGRCQEALDYFGQQVAANPAAVPPASLDTELARAYLCFGQLRGASLYANMANSIEPSPEREWVRAITLFNLGRYNETLDLLDQILAANPNSPGDRYYLRALVHVQRREFDLAQADLDTGSQHTPEQAQLAAYVSGLLSRQSGDQAAAEALFNLAEETLSRDYGLIIDRIRQELGQPELDRGIPLLPNAIVNYQDNPPETIQAPALLVEPDAIMLPVRYDGSGPFHLNIAEPLNLHLYPPVPLDILFVDSLTLRISAANLASLPGVDAALWDFSQSVWTPTGLTVGENPVSDPSRFVNPQGDIYLRIENKSGTSLAIDNLNLTLTIAGQQETGQP